MAMLISFAALFLSVLLLQLGAGGLGPLDAIAGLQSGFSRAEVGLLGSAHFTGFFIGCWITPRLMGTIGHSRTFAVCAAIGTIGIIAHTLFVGPLLWALLRVMSGLCIAGCYTVIEAWLQAKVDNKTRGRTMGVYRVVDIGGSLGAQLLIGVLNPESYVSYNILALLCCMALLPLTLTRVPAPKVPAAPRLRPGKAWRMSPLAASAVVVAGLTTAAFRMVGPIYGVEIGLGTNQIAWFLAAFVLGGALAQYPIGWLADAYDRRWVLIWISAAAMASCGTMVAMSAGSPMMIYVGSALFGFMTFPIYSVATAHAHDFASTEERVELSAALMFLYALGAIASPLVTSALIEYAGPSAMFAFVSAAHLILIVFGVARMRVRPTEEDRTAYVYAPRTTFQVGRLFAKSRDKN